MLNLFTQYLHYKGFFHDLRISSIFAGILSFQRILPNFVFELKPNDQVKGELKHCMEIAGQLLLYSIMLKVLFKRVFLKKEQK